MSALSPDQGEVPGLSMLTNVTLNNPVNREQGPSQFTEGETEAQNQALSQCHALVRRRDGIGSLDPKPSSLTPDTTVPAGLACSIAAPVFGNSIP